MLIGIAISIYGLIRGFVGTVTPVPLGPPSNLRYTETMGTPGYVDFSWDAPFSWGSQGPHATDRYQYAFRLESASTGNLNPWGPTINDHNLTTARVHWAAGHRHGPNSLQFRVRSRDAAGATSGWVTSPVLTEDAVNPTGRAFSSGFDRGFS